MKSSRSADHLSMPCSQALRFEATLCDAESIAAAILHPKFRKEWTGDASVLDKGKLAVFVYV